MLDYVDDNVLTTSNGEEGEDADDSVLITINDVKEIMLMILCVLQIIEKNKMPYTVKKSWPFSRPQPGCH
jgi:hypothetical protein